MGSAMLWSARAPASSSWKDPLLRRSRAWCGQPAFGHLLESRYGAAEIAVDSAIKARLDDRGIKAHSFNGRLLHEPWEITNQAGKPFQVFTPYLRAVDARRMAPRASAPSRLSAASTAWHPNLLSDIQRREWLDPPCPLPSASPLGFSIC
jgi:deoxyribodipyrimidine photolyase